MATPPATPPPLSPEDLAAALDRFIRDRVDPSEAPLVAALTEFIRYRVCPVYLRDAATAWLKGKS